ncbi:MAG: FAD-binding protein [Pseudarcicella sp.]|nr:FAD-binding protein [Pseudarcicella sp.]MBP6409525.1 FAD-binding protein [Pseudarcicella sp.]
MTITDFIDLQHDFEGELFYDKTVEHQSIKKIYATDASVYQEKPTAVSIPKNKKDLQLLINFAKKHKKTLIPRAAGTSLAGQVVGNGIVVDISKHFNQVLEINTEEQWVTVQPGIIRDDLNAILKNYKLMFGPETSTSSRAMIGGMVGNNSSGLHSIAWGSTRDNIIALKMILSDGNEVCFEDLTKNEYYKKTQQNNLESNIYRELHKILNDPSIRKNIQDNFPDPAIKRRNTGYALDLLLDNQPFIDNEIPFNLSKLIAGSEGTLGIITEIKLQLMPLPPSEIGLVCINTHTLEEALEANIIALKHRPVASELVDKLILDFTKGHPQYENNRFFITGDPEAILMVEFMDETEDKINIATQQLITELKEKQIGYAYTVAKNEHTKPVWEIRKAGLGLIRNQKGDTLPVNLIEDCAVLPQDLPQYIAEIKQLLQNNHLKASYYAHAGAGEIHIEPFINLKTDEGKVLFRKILHDTTHILKKYKGSLSGEHGDGRLRGEFIAEMVGQQNYQLFKEVKQLFDPNNIFNRGKIVDTPPMNEKLRFDNITNIGVGTIFDYTEQESILKLTEKCSGSGDCKKTAVTGGTMCPSFMATRLEKDSTRARANILRQYLSSEKQSKQKEWLKEDIHEVKEIMDLCLSCKACKTECPSNVDVSKLKAEFTQHYTEHFGVSFRTQLITNFTKINKWAIATPNLYNFFVTNYFTSKIIKNIAGFSLKRSLPKLGKQTLRSWHRKWATIPENNSHTKKEVYLFCDEFTNYNDVEIGIKAIKLLTKLGYKVTIPNHVESGRVYLSKGLVKKAKEIAIKNVSILNDYLSQKTIPIIGIEPSAILTLKDEYLELMPKKMKKNAQFVAKNTFLFEDFIETEIDNNYITKDFFTKEKKNIKLHVHCHQKALSKITSIKKVLSLPQNYEVQLIPSGCCGMAGSFGYEEEHYDLSMQIGNLVLFPQIEKTSNDIIIAASGTSCRHQIKDGTQREALHSIEILYQALI